MRRYLVGHTCIRRLALFFTYLQLICKNASQKSERFLNDWHNEMNSALDKTLATHLYMYSFWRPCLMKVTWWNNWLNNEEAGYQVIKISRDQWVLWSFKIPLHMFPVYVHDVMVARDRDHSFSKIRAYSIVTLVNTAAENEFDKTREYMLMRQNLKV